MLTKLELMKIELEEKKNLLSMEDYQDVNEPSTKDLIERVKRLEEKIEREMLKSEVKEIEEEFKTVGEMNVDDNTKRKYFELLCEINELEYVDSIKEDIKRLKELQDICFTVTFGSEYVKVNDVLKQYLIFGKENKKFSGETEVILEKLFKYFSENNLIIEYYKSFPTTPDLYEILEKVAEMI